MSWDTHMRNLTLAQENDDLVLRLRTQQTDLNGLLAGEPFARVRGAFRSARWLSVELRIRPGSSRSTSTASPQSSPTYLRRSSGPDPAFSLALERDDLRSALARRDLRRRGQGAGSRARLRGC